MNTLADLDINVLVGPSVLQIDTKTSVPFSEEAISFLSELSKQLLKNKIIREYRDLAGFGYWCRKANLSSLAQLARNNSLYLGRGLAFHIAPSNVPLNFAFSWAFGLLAGCPNIVRLPTRRFEQSEYLCNEIRELFGEEKFKNLAASNSFIRYDGDDYITSSLSKMSDVRLIWGGDATVKHIRTLSSAPRCLDLCFPDRYSVCILGAASICKANEIDLKKLILNFFNDVFLLDQNACSSPHLVIWQGNENEVEIAKNKFWRGVQKSFQTEYELTYAIAVEKYLHLLRSLIATGPNQISIQKADSIYRIQMESLPSDLPEIRGSHGFFVETTDNSLDKLMKIVSQKFQTITYFGVNKDEIALKIVNRGITGIDRIVPIGKALDMSVYWDGFDMVRAMSREIVTE